MLAAACGGDEALSGGRDGGALGDAGAVADGGTAADDAGLRPDGTWRTEASLPAPFQEISVVVHQGAIWLVGGFRGGTPVGEVWRYLPQSGSWEPGPALPAPRHHLSVVPFGDDLYAFGGYETLRFEPLDTAWVLRDGASTWTPVAPLPDDRGATAADRVGDVIVLAGGNGRRNTLAQRTLVYAPAEDRWSFGAPIPTPREHLAAEAHDGELWVLAGRENSLSSNRTEVEIYDPEADAWRPGPASPTPRGGFDVAVLDGFLYAVGGETPRRALDEVDRLRLATGVWEVVPPVPTPRHGHGVVAFEGRVWVVGGGDEPTFAAVAVVESFAP